MTARWGAPQQQDSLIGSEPGDSPHLVKHCPKCYEQMSAASRVCHRCLTSLSDVTAVSRESSDVTGDAEPIRLWRYLLRVPGRRAIQMILLAALVSVVYAQCFWPESSRDEASGSRSLVTGPGVWSAVGGDTGGARVSMANPPLHGAVVWARQLDSRPATSLIADDDTLFVGLEDARLVAYSIVDGSELWSFPVPGQLDESPVVAGDTLFASLRSGGLVALDADSGHVRWRVDTDHDFLTGPALFEGVVWVGGRGEVLSFDAETGEQLGGDEFDGTSLSYGVPAVGNERIVVRTWRRLRFYDLESGHYQFFARHYRSKYVAAGHGAVVGVSKFWILTFDENVSQPWWEGFRSAWVWADLWGLAPPTPDQPFRWAERLNCSPFAPVLQRGQVIVACENGRVLAVSLETGQFLWEREGTPLVDAPVLTEDGLFLLEENALVVIDSKSGNEIERRVFDDAALAQMLVTSGGVYLLTADDEIRALR